MMDKEILLIVVNAGIAVAGGIMAIFLNRLIKSIDLLISEDARLNSKIQEHREDVLRNYVRSDQIEGLKKDLIGRVDRMESTFKDALVQHEHRERQELLMHLQKSKNL